MRLDQGRFRYIILCSLRIILITGTVTAIAVSMYVGTLLGSRSQGVWPRETRALSLCKIEDLQIYHPHTNTRRVPPSTKVTVKCFTSHCEHVHINVKQSERELNCTPIDRNGIRTCNITIMEPVELICVGVHDDECECKSSRSILIEIENSTANAEHPTEKLPCNCSTTSCEGNRTSIGSAVLNQANVSLTIMAILISLIVLF
ncbi:PREDICTED: uncharacterized protein LOC109590260 [Amphimedon queenslandica]|uniref:Uncharacterized protein n=1 Tax=Amphimedon queenslandica TaxID=400682 RepID=A0AAN0JXR4_AMPQE|nr:PREDICTED: uncharacterized protein LOC109590260 [Amphimedon queenslandica]|eukprot:XP_019861743.1 PREDICTED: uncharacterized protein LOC109590260 [Amphimedon queenslandica]